MASFKLPNNKCPYCGCRGDGATGVNGSSIPKQGDVSLCFYCAGLCVFDEQLSLQKADPELLEEIKKDDPEAYRILLASVDYIRSKPSVN